MNKIEKILDRFGLQKKSFPVGPAYGSNDIAEGIARILRGTRTQLDYRQVDATFSSAFMACLSTITRAFSEVEIEVRRKTSDDVEEAVEDHPLEALMRRPSAFFTPSQIWNFTLANYFITGNAYLLIIRNGVGQPVELMPVPASLMRPRWPKDGSAFISYYEYLVDGKPTRIPVQDVVHFRHGIDYSGSSLGRCGVSPIQSVLNEIFTDEESAAFVSTILVNMGVPGVIITPKGESVTLDNEDRAAFVEAYQQATAGAKRGRALLYNIAMDMQRLGFSPSEIDFKDVRRIVEERVSAVMCVPAIIAGLGAGLDRSTYSNTEEAQSCFWQNCMVPLMCELAEVLNIALLSQFGDASTSKVVFCTEDIAAMQEDGDALSARIRANWQAGIMTLNEARTALGLQPDTAGDYYLRPVNQGALPMNTPAPGLEQVMQDRSRSQIQGQDQLNQTDTVE